MSDDDDNWAGADGAFFVLDGTALRPRMHAASLWGAQLNGRSLSGLVAYAVERDQPDPEFRVARMSIDMFRAVPLVPIQLTTTVVRDGHRIRVVDVAVTDTDGVVLGRGSVALLRNLPAATVAPSVTWDVAGPDALPEPSSRRPPWEVRSPRPGPNFGRGAWVREYFDLVEGSSTSPLVRTAMAADLANAVANAADGRIGYINTDLQIHLERLPTDEWTGVEAIAYGADEGVAWGSCDLHDRVGRIGHVSFSALADNRIVDSPDAPRGG
jgi:hypothetical protein